MGLLGNPGITRVSLLVLKGLKREPEPKERE